MEIKIGKRFKANDLLIDIYKLNNNIIRLMAISNGNAIVECDGINMMIKLSTFTENVSDKFEPIPRTIQDWKNTSTDLNQTSPPKQDNIKPIEPVVEPTKPIEPIKPVVEPTKPVEPIVEPVKPIEPVVKPVEPTPDDSYPYSEEDYPY
ncbi:MAG TPA: hypothetical protein P5277_05165 [Candidatus Paceibacterota bacterium]|nr:hypothetical protein [Candidatus Paceibacterota bacterium]